MEHGGLKKIKGGADRKKSAESANSPQDAPPASLEERLALPVRELKPSGIREFFDIVAGRDDVISLGVGEPDFVSPTPVIQAAINSLRNGFTHYTGNQGIPSLRKAIAEYLEKEYDLSYHPEKEIMITVGVSQALDITLRSIINPGERIIYPRPSYVSYAPMISMAGGIPEPVSATSATEFRADYHLLSAANRQNAKALLLNYPCNPTGASYNREQLTEISRFVVDNDLLVISDEIYAELSYDTRHVPIATLPGMKERTMLLGGFSKSFAMTGFRIGYICGPEPWLKAVLKIHQYSMLCAPTVGQIAAETAMKECIEERDRMFDAYRIRRNEFVSGLNDIGLQCHLPAGAFYAFPDIRSTGLTSLKFAHSLLEKESVAVVPGSAFGPEGEGFIRCSFATSLGDLKTAVSRMKNFTDNLKKGAFHV